MAFRDIPDEDLQAFAEGRKSLDDLAATAGVSKQAVSQALRRRGIRRGASVASPAPSAPAAPQTAFSGLPAASATPPTPETFADMVRAELVNLAALAIIEGGKLLRGEKAAVGASALKAIVAAATMARAELEAAGIIDEATDELERFDIRIMSQAEADAHQDALDAEDADSDVEVCNTTEDQGDQDTPAPTPPPDLEALRMKLAGITAIRGAAGLRALAVQHGAPAGRTAEALTAGLLDHAARHPDVAKAIRGAA